MADFHLQALNEAGQGNWQKSHDMVENFDDVFSCLIHGFLHRQEGDMPNARYWYNRAGQSMPNNSLDDEFVRIYELVSAEDGL